MATEQTATIGYDADSGSRLIPGERLLRGVAPPVHAPQGSALVPRQVVSMDALGKVVSALADLLRSNKRAIRQGELARMLVEAGAPVDSLAWLMTQGYLGEGESTARAIVRGDGTVDVEPPREFWYRILDRCETNPPGLGAEERTEWLTRSLDKLATIADQERESLIDAAVKDLGDRRFRANVETKGFEEPIVCDAHTRRALMRLSMVSDGGTTFEAACKAAMTAGDRARRGAAVRAVDALHDAHKELTNTFLAFAMYRWIPTPAQRKDLDKARDAVDALKLVRSAISVELLDGHRDAVDAVRAAGDSEEPRSAASKKRGGRSVGPNKMTEEAEVAKEWKLRSERGTCKADFARERSMTLAQLDNLLDRVRKRIRNLDSE